MRRKSTMAGALVAAAVMALVACRGGDDEATVPAGAVAPAPAVPVAPSAPEPEPAAAPAATPTPESDAAAEPAATPAPDAGLTRADDTRADGASPEDAGQRALEPYEIEAQLKVLAGPRDVLDVFLTTQEPQIRHAILTEATRGRITAKGLATFYAAAPGLVDLPLPLVALSYSVEAAPVDGDGLHRFVVQPKAAGEGGQRSVAYYTLRDEADGPRVVWDRRDAAAARLLLARGEYDGAEKLARAVRKLSPYCGDCEEVIFWARSRREGGRKAWKSAGEHARRAVDWEPLVASHHNALGVYFRNMRQYERARAQFDEALALDPDSPAAGNLALLLEHEGKDREALRAIDAYVARQPDELWPRLSRCRILRGLGRHEDAVAACRAATERRQDADESAHIAETWYVLANSLKDLGRKDEALAAAEKAVAHSKYWVYVKLRDELKGK